MASRRARGFGLIEAVVAITVLALTTAAVFSGWSVMLRQNAKSHLTGIGAQVARAEIETAKLSGADGLPLGTYNPSNGSGTWNGAYDPTANAGAGDWVSSTTTYYDTAGNSVTSGTSAGAVLAVQDSLTDLGVLATSGGGYALQPTSQRELVTTVTLVSDGSMVARMATILVQGGL